MSEYGAISSYTLLYVYTYVATVPITKPKIDTTKVEPIFCGWLRRFEANASVTRFPSSCESELKCLYLPWVPDKRAEENTETNKLLNLTSFSYHT